jgi:hypothetical protein
MTRYAILLAPLALLGCNGDKDDSGSANDGADGADGGACTVELSAGYPADGSSDAYYRSDIEFNLSEEDSSASLSLEGPDGAVSGTSAARTNADGTFSVVFTPDASLTPSTNYTANAEACNGDASGSISFTTSGLGTATDCDPTGETYILDLANARFLEPAGVADLLLGQLEDDIMVGVESKTDNSIQMVGAIGNGGTQDYCNPTIPFPEADFEDPYFVIGPEDASLSVAGVTVEISQLRISGDISSDCTYIGGAVMSGELDARVLAPLVGELLGGSDDPDEVCTLLINFGVTCGACASDGKDYCVDILADQINGDGGGTSISCVDEEECHASCSTSTCGDTSAGECD